MNTAVTINTPKIMSRLPTITYIALALPILINEAILNTTLNTVVPMKTHIKDDCIIVELMLFLAPTACCIIQKELERDVKMIFYDSEAGTEFSFLQREQHLPFFTKFIKHVFNLASLRRCNANIHLITNCIRMPRKNISDHHIIFTGLQHGMGNTGFRFFRQTIGTLAFSIRRFVQQFRVQCFLIKLNRLQQLAHPA